MRLPLAALAAALVAAIGFVPLPAIGAVEPGFALSCGSATAGADVPCTISRATSGKGLYVLFETADSTAHAGTDYTAVRQLLYFKPSALTQTVAVHTALNPSAAGTLTFNAAIAASTLVVRSTGSIVEPAPQAPPAPPPAPSPIPSAWVAAPLQAGGYAQLAASVSGAPKPGGFYPFTIANYVSTYRTPAAGEVFKVDPNGSGYDSDNRPVWEVHPLTGEETLYFYASDLAGVAPTP